MNGAARRKERWRRRSWEVPVDPPGQPSRFLTLTEKQSKQRHQRLWAFCNAGDKSTDKSALPWVNFIAFFSKNTAIKRKIGYATFSLEYFLCFKKTLYIFFNCCFYLTAISPETALFGK
jgi:hypothetical protein